MLNMDWWLILLLIGIPTAIIFLIVIVVLLTKSNHERGDYREINLPRLYEISYYLNVSISYILDNSSYLDRNYLFKDFQLVISKLNTSKRNLLLNIAKQLDDFK